jgi:hypothetical protein
MRYQTPTSIRAFRVIFLGSARGLTAACLCGFNYEADPTLTFPD